MANKKVKHSSVVVFVVHLIILVGGCVVDALETAKYKEIVDLLPTNPTASSSNGPRFGNAIAVAGKTAVIGGWFDDNQKGSAYFFREERVDGAYTWVFKQKLLAPNGAVRFGNTIVLSEDGTQLLVGSYLAGSPTQSGRVYSYAQSNGYSSDWTLAQTIAPDGLTDNGGTWFNNQFGYSIAITSVSTGTYRAVIGSPGANKAYIFTKIGEAEWHQSSVLQISCINSDCGFGESVDIYGDTIAIGAPRESGPSSYGEINRSENGEVHMYTFDETYSTAWTDGILSFYGDRSSQFGINVQVKYTSTYKADTVVVGFNGVVCDGSCVNYGRIAIFKRLTDGFWDSNLQWTKGTWERTDMIWNGADNVMVKKFESGIDSNILREADCIGFATQRNGISLSSASIDMGESEDLLVVGGEGAVHFFTSNSTTDVWQLKNVFAGSRSDYFGSAVGAGSDSVMVGCVGCDEWQGRVKAYTRDYSTPSSSAATLTGLFGQISASLVAFMLL